MVDCFYDAASNALCLLAGSYGGHGTLAVVEPAALHVCGELRAGHTATVRCAAYVPGAAGAGAGAGARLFTGGEDARLCAWGLSADAAEGSGGPAKAGASASGLKAHHGGAGGKADRRHRPY